MVTERDVRGVLAVTGGGDEERQRVQTILERALNYRQCVCVLHDILGVEDEVIAHVARVVPASVRRWRSSTRDVAEPRLAQSRGIEQLRSIALVFVQSGTFYDMRGVGVWLQTGRQNLGWKAPYEILAESDTGFAQTLHEAEMFVMPGAGSGCAAAVAGFGPPRPDLHLLASE